MTQDSTDERDSTRPLASGAEASEWQPVVERSFERDGDGDLVGAIIGAVATAEGVPATTIRSPPLFENIDIFALEALFFGRAGGGTNRDCLGQVQFHYRGFRVTVTSDGQIVVAEPVAGDGSG